MCKTFEDLAEKRADEKVLEDRKATAIRLLKMNTLSLEQISEGANLPIEVVEKLANLQPV